MIKLIGLLLLIANIIMALTVPNPYIALVNAFMAGVITMNLVYQFLQGK